MVTDPGFDIVPTYDPMGFSYGPGTFGPVPELRTLDAIRPSLKDSDCDGPEVVYAIAMDVGRRQDLPAMIERDLLYGVVTYSKGLLGTEPVRSQGHIHATSPSCGASTCEVYEIWSGAAYIYMQESAKDDPGRCYAVYAQPGQVVIVPPGWAHATIVGDVTQNLTFGAWCVRDYGFDYDDVRAHNGIAWFPQADHGRTTWVANAAYGPSELVVCGPRAYTDFGLAQGVPIYQQFVDDPDLFLFVSKPDVAKALWEGFEP